ncbi:MAG: hypothetical protein KTR14_02360 [Vampirovibrio sp.]|nr:hypothetical protein [Vampirovibrio sp.]
MSKMDASHGIDGVGAVVMLPKALRGGKDSTRKTISTFKSKRLLFLFTGLGKWLKVFKS